MRNFQGNWTHLGNTVPDWLVLEVADRLLLAFSGHGECVVMAYYWGYRRPA